MWAVRILAVTPYYEPEGGGLERYAHAVLSRIVREGHDVQVVTSTRAGSREESREGVRLRRRAPRFSLGNAPIDPALPAVLKQSIRSSRPDVVVAHTPVPFPAEMAYRAAQEAQVPFVATYHAGRLRGSTFALDALAHLDRWTLERSMLEGSRRLIAVSPFVRKSALRRHRDRVTVVPPGVDTHRFKPDGSPGARRVLFVGPLARTYRWKGVDVLWQAFRRVRKRFPDAELTLVGDGARRARFVEKAKKEGVRLRTPGRVGLDQLVREYQRATLTVLPSTSEAESFGMVLAEANACGRPVVASRIGGIGDFVKDGENGRLVEPGDAQDLAETIMEVFRDPGQADAMGRRGRRRVVRDHDWDALTHRTLEVYRRASDAA